VAPLPCRIRATWRERNGEAVDVWHRCNRAKSLQGNGLGGGPPAGAPWGVARGQGGQTHRFPASEKKC